ncbi:MAG: branched-chain amino acid ABC transporter substrate-binding protein, partial [Bradyrhizobium sp.]|nr:branched-chain amino acid ABC transporter substrate-binding protein [Bradyrhizobium sp.]
QALKTTKPGTSAFRGALRDAILSTRELPGVHAIYNFKPGAVTGVDERSLVIVRLTDGAWKYAP